MSKETIKHILTQTQEHGASHQKYLLRLEKYFNEVIKVFNQRKSFNLKVCF